jgi:crotonobetainyl-CoA:carnitine CoA-transferase CaiB-like acyl-CoA transferase
MATMVLADFGADVIRVEPPEGDRFRVLPAAPLWLRGKRSCLLDLRAAGGRHELHALVATADVVVVSGPPSRATRWGIDAEQATRLRPGLVHCSITGWGPKGPFAEVPGYEGAVAAAAGRMLYFQRQLRRGGPVFAAVGVAGHCAAQGAVQGVLAGLLARFRGGGAQRVETSLLQGLLPYDLTELLVIEMAQRRGVVLPDISSSGGDLPTLNYHPVRTADGRWIQCGNLLEHLLYAFLEATGLLEEMIADPRFSDRPAAWDPDAVEAARDMILNRLQEKSAAEWMAIFTANGNVAAEPFRTTAQAMDHPDIVANGSIATVEQAEGSPLRMLGPMATLSRTPAVAARPAPRPGQHTAEIRAELATRGRPLPAPRKEVTDRSDPRPVEAAESGAPLAGITVVEFATIIAAPLATSMLADLGARVVKLEPMGGDPYRHMMSAGSAGAKTTAGKSSICANLRTEEGRHIAWNLAREADVVVHNFRPGVAERLGLGEDDLRAANPWLIWVSLTGYGRFGPSAHRPSTHPCAGAAMGGAAWQSGSALDAACESLEEVREIARQLMRSNESSPDPNTAAVLASAVLVALLARERFGFGQAVHADMLTANLYANADDAIDYEGRVPRPVGDAELYGLSAGYRLYRAAEGWIFLAVTDDVEWKRCFDVLGIPEVALDPRFGNDAARAEHDAALRDLLSGAFAGRAATEWEARFVAAGLAGMRADRDTPGAFYSRGTQVLANEFSPLCNHARYGPHRRWGPIVRVNGGLGTYAPGVVAGQHTDEILGELGYGPSEIDKLKQSGVVGGEPAEVDWSVFEPRSGRGVGQPRG